MTTADPSNPHNHPPENAEDVAVEKLAVAAWRTPDEEGEAPCDYWWGCTKDTFTVGYKMGHQAALEQRRRADRLQSLLHRLYGEIAQALVSDVTEEAT